MLYDNPAARLLAILRRGKEIPATSKCHTAWQQVLNVQDNDALLMSRLGKVMELPDLSLQALRETFPARSNIATHWAERVNHAFMVHNLTEKWETFINHIDHHTTNYLEIAAELLQAKSNTKLIADDALLSLRGTLDVIATEILAASAISDELKRYLNRSLRNIIIRIDEYMLTRALPLLEGVLRWESER